MAEEAGRDPTKLQRLRMLGNDTNRALSDTYMSSRREAVTDADKVVLALSVLVDQVRIQNDLLERLIGAVRR